MNFKLKAVILALTVLTMLSSCTLIRFESVEEQRRREQEAISNAAAEKPRPADYLAKDLTLDQTLKNQAGRLLAEYSVKMPQFRIDDSYSLIFERINEYYQRELEGCLSDSEGFFQTVKRLYGEEWEVLEIIDGTYRLTYFYELLPTPENYICIKKTYVYDSPKGSYTHYYPDVFLAENGWKLEFDDLFGHNADEAHELVVEGITKWCAENGVGCEKLGDLAADDFILHYAMDDLYLIFYADPFMLSTNDKNGYEIRLDLMLFSELFVDGGLK